MPVIDQFATSEPPPVVTPEAAAASIASLVGSDRWPAFLDLMQTILRPHGKAIVNRLLTERDLQERLQISLASAKRILEHNADVQAGRYWRMTETRFQECIRNRRFRTNH